MVAGEIPVARCPTCRRGVPPGTAHAPFCSDRCRLLDLGRWLREEFAVPAPERSGEEE